MIDIPTNIKIQISEKNMSKILKHRFWEKNNKESIILIDEIGFDNFTFKKLGERIGSKVRFTAILKTNINF
jgi:nucleoside-triphosphatase THEP1